MINALRFFARVRVNRWKMAAAQKRELHDLLEVMVFDDESTSSSSSEDEDMDILLYHVVFPPKPPLQVRISLEDYSDVEFEQLFR